MTKRKTGTREWAEKSFNVGTGCSNFCLYCYAASSALRWGTVKSREQWAKEKLKPFMPGIPAGAPGTRVMLPTTHDITPFYLETVLEAALKILQAGNQLLLVSKPRVECIERLCMELAAFKSNVLFRFTIGALDEKLVALWEPGAPTVAERIKALHLTFRQGYTTSVSMEPMLGDVEEALATFHRVEPWVNEKIWLGKMNQIERRVFKSSPEVAAACELVKRQQTDAEMLRLVQRLKGHPKVAWKDSIQELIDRNPATR